MSEREHEMLTVAEIGARFGPLVERNGYTGDEAQLVLDEFIASEILGRPAFGLARLSQLLAFDRRRTRTHPRIHTQGAVTRVDGGGRLAQVALPGCLDALSDGVAACGVGASALHNVTTLLRAGTVTFALARRGLIGLCAVFTNAQIVGTAELDAPMLGINVLSIAVPTGATPFVYDSALATMSRRGLDQARRDGARTGNVVGLDAAGRETNDPRAVRDLVPFGGTRGLGLSLAVELLAGALLGFERTAEHQTYAADNGLLAIGLDPSRLGDVSAFLSRVSQWIAVLCDHGRLDFRIPGQGYARLIAACPETRVAVARETVAQLAALLDERSSDDNQGNTRRRAT